MEEVEGFLRFLHPDPIVGVACLSLRLKNMRYGSGVQYVSLDVLDRKERPIGRIQVDYIGEGGENVLARENWKSSKSVSIKQRWGIPYWKAEGWCVQTVSAQASDRVR